MNTTTPYRVKASTIASGLQVDRHTVSAWCKRNAEGLVKLRAIRVGNQWRIHIRDAEETLTNGTPLLTLPQGREGICAPKTAKRTAIAGTGAKAGMVENAGKLGTLRGGACE